MPDTTEREALPPLPGPVDVTGLSPDERFPDCHVCGQEFFPFCTQRDCPGLAELESATAYASQAVRAAAPEWRPIAAEDVARWLDDHDLLEYAERVRELFPSPKEGEPR